VSDRHDGTRAPPSTDLRAEFVSAGAEGERGIAAPVGGMGLGPLRFPAVLVPEGAGPPGYPFVEFGEFHGNDEAIGAPGSSHGNPATERALQAHRSSNHTRGHTRAPRQAAEGAAASDLTAVEDDAGEGVSLAAPAGDPPAVAHDRQGQLRDYAADAMSAALHALAVPPTYDSLSELVDLAMAGNRSATLPRLT
jgi:hypothetical protein